MPSNPTTDFLAVLITLAIGFTAGPYPAAIFIALIASFTRTAFENVCYTSHSQCFFRWMRYFVMSLGISLFMVSACLYTKLDTHLSVMVSAFFAVFSEETLRFGKANVEKVLSFLISRGQK